jgi:predicted methyltransferase
MVALTNNLGESTLRKLLIASACLAISAFAAAQGLAADSKSDAKAAKPMAIPASISTAVTDAGRPKADTDVDNLRKPAESLAFAGVKPGMTVLEYIPGGGYFTRLLAKAVSPGGHVYVYGTPARAGGPAAPGIAIAADSRYGGAITYYDGAITYGQGLNNAPKVPAPVDLVWTSRNYHDFTAPQRAALNQAAFDALKPGGTYFILDHSAVTGTGDFAMNQPGGSGAALHRIDENLVKLEVMKLGFKLVGESDVLRNPKDDRLTKVFDSAIRGDTDQFILKFQKPKK